MLNAPSLFAIQISNCTVRITVLSFDVLACAMFQSRSGYSTFQPRGEVPVYLATLDLHHVSPVMLNLDP